MRASAHRRARIMPDPSVRARHMKLFVNRISELEAGVREVIFDRIGAADLRAIEEAGPLAWLPVGINVRATEVVWGALAPSAREPFFLRLGMEDFDSPLLKAIVGTAQRLFGVDPGALLKFAARGWSQVFRDDVVLTAATLGKGIATLSYTGLPKELVESRIWISSVAASMSAIFAVTNVRGTVTARDVNVASGTMTLEYRWEC